jgi:hypothetical protein
VSVVVGELPPEVLARMSWWQRQRYLRRLNDGRRPTDPPYRHTYGDSGYSDDDLRAANRAYDRWSRGLGPALDDDERDAYRAYKRRQRNLLAQMAGERR